VFAQNLLQHALKQQVTRMRKASLFGTFGRVLLQDSTTLALPDTLAKYFPGNISRGIQKAVARIQCIIEIRTMRFMHFSLSGFNCNDQSASSLISNYLKKNDLVIRDLGYFVLKSLEKISREARFLSRLRSDVNVYDQKGQCLDLKKLLGKNQVDQWVWIGKNQRLPVRLVMLRLPAAQAAERIRKARKNRDKRLNHSKAYYKWLHYTSFVTNVDEKTWSAQQVAEAYKIRWQIEIIFKSWKSSFNLQQIIQDYNHNVHRVKTAILLMLLFICLFIQKIYMHYQQSIEKKECKAISLLKLSKYLAANLFYFFSMNRQQLLEQIARHCCYEKRPDRTNMTDLIKLFKN